MEDGEKPAGSRSGPDRWFLGSKSAKDVFNEMVALSMTLVGGN